MSDLTKYDAWLRDDGPAALVLRQYLMPVEGSDGVLFPATFAAAEDKRIFAGGYNIDTPIPDKPENVCLVDSVGSQANRIEPLFATDEYADLVPQIVIEAGEKAINLVEAGHRAGDALVRSSALKADLHAAFKAVLSGNAEPLAKIAPTSLVFGVWDSRDTQAKLPRLLSSTIRAFNVRKLTRSAQYGPPIDYAALDVFSEEERAKAEGDTKSPLAKRGFVHVPASGSHGGVIADGGVRRDVTVSLGALRLLAVREAGTLSTDRTLALRRYILGLTLVAFATNPSTYLRQGCNLVLNPDRPAESVEVHADGRRVALMVSREGARAYAEVAAKTFGVGASRRVPFDPDRARKDVAGTTDKMKGIIAAVDVTARQFTLKISKPKKDVVLKTDDTTVYEKGGEGSSFEAVIVKNVKVEVELNGDIVARVASKK